MKQKYIRYAVLIVCALALILCPIIFVIVHRQTKTEDTAMQDTEITTDTTEDYITQSESVEESTQETEVVQETETETQTQIESKTRENVTTVETVPVKKSGAVDTVISDSDNEDGQDQGDSKQQNTDFVADLKAAQGLNQLIVVSATGKTAKVSMHKKDASGQWNQLFETDGFVGVQGVGQASESLSRTPVGLYSLSFALGILDNPGTSFSYTKVDDYDYWVDDPASSHYNEFVSTQNTEIDWNSAEHIIEETNSYGYVIPIDYNTSRTPGEGSAIFLHCSNGKPTAGCVSVPEAVMKQILRNIASGCKILIDNKNNIEND